MTLDTYTYKYLHRDVKAASVAGAGRLWKAQSRRQRNQFPLPIRHFSCFSSLLHLDVPSEISRQETEGKRKKADGRT